MSFQYVSTASLDDVVRVFAGHPNYGYCPLLVFGDSDGDAWMLRDFKDTAVGVIVNRIKKGEIGADSKLAAEQLGNPNARFILQGRDEHTGLMIPDEKSVKYGKTERRLLA